MSPTVEVNIPVVDGKVNRTIQGCFCLDDSKGFLVAHRGGRVYKTPFVIPKVAIHQHFSEQSSREWRWLENVTDDDQQTTVIRVSYVDSHLVKRMAAFADRIAALKSQWRG